jgi:hypothetical protein
MPFLLSFILFMTTGTFLHKENTKTYRVKRVPGELAVTGKGEDRAWKKAVELTDFICPWESEKPQFTSFKALHNKEWVYCLFNIQDDSIKIYVDKNDKREAVRSDRAEIFFRIDEKLSPYYCLEMDPMARVFDAKGEFYRKIDSQWTWPAGGLIVKADQRKDGYSVEIAIRKSSLIELGLLKNNRIEAGLFRADCTELNGKKATFRWISWVDPKTENPDFHTPSAFGALTLEE